MLRTGTRSGFRPKLDLRFWSGRAPGAKSQVPVADVGRSAESYAIDN